jgi:hypothetical protein
MDIQTATPDTRKDSAAQNAQEGLITVADLSLLTGLPVSQLTKFAKAGRLEHFGEYHGKRFFNFQTIVAWAAAAGTDDEARTMIWKGIENELLSTDCPYVIETSAAEVKLYWKVARAA